MSAATAIWHDLECGGYDADLALWEELADRAGDPVLELGCGTGRVALHLARRGHRVFGVDRDPDLTAVLAARAEDLPVEALAADARELDLEAEFALALAPMQFLQLLPSESDLVACLRGLAAALRPGGLLAAAIVERLPEADAAAPPLPDVRDVKGWVYSSLPVEAAVGAGEIVLRRLRQTVSPAGELSEDEDEVRLRTFAAAELEATAEAAGLHPAGRRAIPMTDTHVGSLVVLLERGR
jgi:SAM-dependent methyltransferase